MSPAQYPTVGHTSWQTAGWLTMAKQILKPHVQPLKTVVATTYMNWNWPIDFADDKQAGTVLKHVCISLVEQNE